MIYFDNAATGGQKPDTVQIAVSSAIKLCANPGRSSHPLSLACATQVQNCRYTLNSMFDGYGFDRVVFTKNCTEALNIALLGVLHKGDHVIATCMEHNSVLRPLEYLKNMGVIDYDVCPLRGKKAQACLCAEDITSLLRPNTRLVAVTAASNVTAKHTLKLGLHTEQTCQDADGDKNGSNQIETTIVAAAVDADGKVVAAASDCVQVKFTFDATGASKYDLTKKVSSKREAGANYGMVSYGNAAKEWFEQADVFNAACVGKTASEIVAMMGSDNYGNTELQSAGCTILVNGFVKAVSKLK